MTTSRVVGEAIRRAYPRVLARLLAHTRDLTEAEDAVQDALERAAELWPATGLPDHPEAWLVTVAKNRFLDGMRRRRRHQRSRDELAAVDDATPWSVGLLAWPATPSPSWGDDLLRLLFVGCDPVLSRGEAVALTLSTVTGLSTRELGAAFAVAPRTMEQRLTRARRRLRERRGAFDVPTLDQSAERLGAVLQVVEAVYDAGYWAAEGPPIRGELCELALSLARSLHLLRPDDAEVTGLRALLTLHEARRPARRVGDRFVPLPEQNRSRYDRALLDEGLAFVRAALEPGPGFYPVRAAIAAVHTEAPSAAETDWAQICVLYDIAMGLRVDPVLQVNRAFAHGRAHGPERGLALLDEVELEGRPYPYLHLVRGHLLADAGQVSSALAALRRARDLARNEEEAQQITAAMTRLEKTLTPESHP